MPSIDFSSGVWNSAPPRAGAGGVLGNSYNDPATDPSIEVQFIIASGKMNVDSVQGNAMLFFSTVGCQDMVGPTATLLIRFSQAAAEQRTDRRGVSLELASSWANWVVVWPLIVGAVVFVGWHVVASGTEPRWPLLLFYLLLVAGILSAA